MINWSSSRTRRAIKTARNLGVIPWDQAVIILNRVTIRNRIWSSDFHFNRQLIKLIAKWSTKLGKAGRQWSTMNLYWKYHLVRPFCVMKGRLTFCTRQWKLSFFLFVNCQWNEENDEFSLYFLFPSYKTYDFLEARQRLTVVVGLSFNIITFYLIQCLGIGSIFLLLLLIADQ